MNGVRSSRIPLRRLILVQSKENLEGLAAQKSEIKVDGTLNEAPVE